MIYMSKTYSNYGKGTPFGSLRTNNLNHWEWSRCRKRKKNEKVHEEKGKVYVQVRGEMIKQLNF
jgi:hypothetical protein